MQRPSTMPTAVVPRPPIGAEPCRGVALRVEGSGESRPHEPVASALPEVTRQHRRDDIEALLMRHPVVGTNTPSPSRATAPSLLGRTASGDIADGRDDRVLLGNR
jgi:hypothetical protein